MQDSNMIGNENKKQTCLAYYKDTTQILPHLHENALCFFRDQKV